MDLGMVGFDCLVGSDSCFGSSLSSDPDSTKQKWYGSGRFLGQERSAPASEDEWRTLKVAKTDDFSASKAMLSQQIGSLLRSNSSSLLSDGQHMLSFSSPNSQPVTLPHYHQSSSSNSRNTGYGSGGGGCLNLASMHGVLMGVRGPFTPSQWMELEHQALIYKYITANMPIPHNLLIPIRKALDSAGFSSFTRPSALGWGAFHLGFSNNTDPEPGRCRRTDGKKWRCSRDAVADQKYCERHMNRGRHRSRKPVEGQSGHSVSGPTTTTTVKLASSTSAALVVPGGGTTNSLGLSHHPQLKNLQPGAPNSCASTPHINRFFLNNENVGETIQGATDLSMLSPAISLKPNQFSVPKQPNPYEQSSRSEFGSVCSDSLLNPLHKSSQTMVAEALYVSMEVAGEKIRVQSLSQNDKPHVPPQYIQPPQYRPNAATAGGGGGGDKRIPAIDLGATRADLQAELDRACKDWGAFHVTNHGVPIQLLNEMRRVGVLFFEECPMAEKLRYSCDSNSFASEGYGSRMLVSSNDTVLDWRDYFDHHTLPLSRRNPDRWPHFPPNYREVVAEYGDRMKVLAQRLLSLISESLGLPSSRIEEAVGEFYQNITVSYYPPCPQPELTLGLQAHSDMGAITLLIQDDVGGLQVLKDGEWVNVHPLSDAIVVILADQTEIITNGKYRSAEHRAITNVNKARFSVATFHDPAKTTIISPAAELISNYSPPKYCQVTYGDYVLSWYTKGPEGKRNIDRLLL